MYKITTLKFLIFTCLLFTLTITSFVRAQSPAPRTPPAHNQDTFPASRALSDYSYTYNQYRLADNAYIVAKSEYMTYGTLASKQKALDATKNMVSLRADAIRTYLLALRQTLLETSAIDDTDRNPILQTIDTQVAWVESQRAVIPSAGSLADLVNLSQKLEDKYPELEITYYTALTNILAAHETLIRLNVNYVIGLVKQTVTDQAAKGANTDMLERWLLEAQSRADRAQEKHDEAFGYLAKISAQGFGFNTSAVKASLYHKVQDTLQQENIYLKESVSFLSQTLQEVASAGY